MESLFQKLLDQDEKIIKTIKPNKVKFFFTRSIWAVLMAGFFVCLGVLTCTIRDDAGELAPKALTITLFVLAALFLVGTIVFAVLSYDKRCYAYTNKRVLISYGVLAVNFKTLDMDKVGVINVHISLFDKIVCKHTGTITFGSLASPITPNGASFALESISNPYELYKEIKELIAKTQASQVPSKKK